MSLRVMAHRAPWTGAIEFLVVDDRIGVRSVAKPLTMETRIEGACYEKTEATFRLGFTSAQELMDNLWHCGLRPSEGTGSAGALAATQRHLDDMRKLVFREVQP